MQACACYHLVPFTPNPIVPSIHMPAASNTVHLAQPWGIGLCLASVGQMRKRGSERTSDFFKVTQQVTYLLSFTVFAQTLPQEPKAFSSHPVAEPCQSPL